MKNNFKLFFFFLAVLIVPALCQASTTTLSNTSPDHTVTSGSDEKVYGTSGTNEITIESGARAELINFPGFNAVQIQSSSDLFTVSRSGTLVTFQGSDGTILLVPATHTVQTIAFTDKTLTLGISDNQVMLDDQLITTSPALVSPVVPNVEHELEITLKGTENNVISEFPGEDIGLKVSALSTVENPQFAYQILSSDLDFSLIDDEGNLTAEVPDSAVPGSTLSLRIRVSENISQLTEDLTASVYVMQKNLVGSGVVSEQGGTVADDTNSIRVEVPAGVLDEDTRIEIFRGETDDGRQVINFDTDSIKTDTVKVYLPDLSSENRIQSGSTRLEQSESMDDPERSIQSQIVADYLNWDLQAIDSELNNSTWYMKLAFSWDPRDMSFNPYNFYYRVPGEKISSGSVIDIPVDELDKLKTEERQTFRLLSTYTDRSSLLENDYVPVLFIHGYQRLGKLGGGHGYWGNFPYLMDQLEINGKRIKSFDFHWRSDSRFQDAASDLAKTIKSLSILTANKKIHIIAHSFGGVLARCFLQGLYPDSDNDRLADYVASLISFGSPYSGVFDKATLKNNILFPDGQHNTLINFARNMTAYQMGEEVNYARMKKHLNLDDSPGEIAYQLANTINSIPSEFPMTIGISTIALPYYEHFYDLLPSYPYIEFSEGDGLISFKGQRFFPTLSTNPLLSVAAGNNEINGYPFKINEIFLGFNNDTVPDLSNSIEIWDVTDLSKNEIQNNTVLQYFLIETLNYKHSKLTPIVSALYAKNAQTYVTCNSINNCTHEAFVQTKNHLNAAMGEPSYTGDCGAYIAPGVWKEVDCYNLAAIGKETGADPFTPSWELIGGYWQWGRKGPDQTKNDWYKIATEHFAPGPTGDGSAVEDANAGSIIFWDTISAPNGAWKDDEKTANDPCPVGYRVLTRAQWDAFVNSNTQSRVGTWSSSATNYTSALYFGDKLMLPAAGSRSYNGGNLSSRGYYGYYWSSSESFSNQARRLYFNSSSASAKLGSRRSGLSVRCVAE